jgi:hypothetical protein
VQPSSQRLAASNGTVSLAGEGFASYQPIRRLKVASAVQATEWLAAQIGFGRAPKGTRMLRLIYFSIIFIIIPGIILAFFIIAAVLPGYATDRDAKFSGRAGFWAGLVIFAVYAVTAIAKVTAPDFNAEQLPSFNWLGLIIGTVAGFLLLFLVSFTLPTRGIGVLTLLLCAASTIGLFSYLFNSGTRDFHHVPHTLRRPNERDC